MKILCCDGSAKMIYKIFVIFLLVEVFAVSLIHCGKRNTIALALGEGPGSKITSFENAKKDTLFNNKRRRRSLSSVVALLWPQVVGPVEQGVIEEQSYHDVPKTLLEHRLDMIRKKAQQEEETRLLIRDYLKSLTEAQDKFYGYPPYRERFAGTSFT